MNVTGMKQNKVQKFLGLKIILYLGGGGWGGWGRKGAANNRIYLLSQMSGPVPEGA